MGVRVILASRQPFGSAAGNCRCRLNRFAHRPERVEVKRFGRVPAGCSLVIRPVSRHKPIHDLGPRKAARTAAASWRSGRDGRKAAVRAAQRSSQGPTHFEPMQRQSTRRPGRQMGRNAEMKRRVSSFLRAGYRPPAHSLCCNRRGWAVPKKAATSASAVAAPSGLPGCPGPAIRCPAGQADAPVGAGLKIAGHCPCICSIQDEG